MPTYDYECGRCSCVFEAFHGMSEKPELSCPECDSNEITRRISGGAGVHFKGSGFYVNDYKNKPADSSSPKQKDNASGSTGGKEQKTSKTQPSTAKSETKQSAGSNGWAPDRWGQYLSQGKLTSG